MGDIKVILWTIPDSNPNDVRQLIDTIRRKTDSVAMMFAVVVGEGKVQLLSAFSKDLVEKKFNAVDWIKEICPLIGGSGGGGRPDLGQAGGKDADKIPEAFAAAKKWLEGR